MHLINPSWYAHRQSRSTLCAALEGDTQADVVIIGGGLTGLSAALTLVEASQQVVLLEADRIGSQASGRNGGQALQGLAASMSTVEAAVGLPAAQAIWAMSREALALLKSRVVQYQIECGLSTSGYVYAAAHRGQLAELAQWQADAASRYDYPDLQLLDHHALQHHVRSDAYMGGLFDPHEAHLDPLAYTLGLRDAALAAGARCHEQSAVTGWVREGSAWRVQTDKGSVLAKQLLLAVNAGIGKLAPSLARYFLPVESFIVATEGLGADRARALMPSGAAVADCHRVLNYFRISDDQRLLFGGRASGTATDRAADTRARMLAVFPTLADVAIEHAWGGEVDVTPHKLPHFGRLDEGIYFAQGFSGHGLALTGLAGKLVAEAMQGRPERFDQFAALPQHRLPTHLPGFTRTAITLGMAWFQLRDWIDAHWYRD
ncbi:FAD-binding oxidoreductase [Chitinimonas sp. BJYL2]|uniref:NAD(P)/FAD-dependent oxidoreductase n=1 Tax=Chitinimonas sp. BJYL2 TaxID=2976696 RepID=UPI0022B33232|nr:FAD-binding oxidoreductase [Chitinimonas sp. BJYL2]